MLNYFINKLSIFVDKGLIYTSIDYDQDRYIDCDMILMDMERVKEEFQQKEEKNKVEKISEKPVIGDQITYFLSDIELAEAINKLINETTEILSICSPWIDDIIERQNDLFELKKKKLGILLITLTAEKDSNHYKALWELKRNRSNIETNDNLHSKLIISDNSKPTPFTQTVTMTSPNNLSSPT